MRIKEVFSSTKEEIESKKFNIFLPICLGNKFFLNGNFINEKNIKEYLEIALEYTQEKVLFLIADKIQVTNYNVRNNNKKSYNIRRVLREGKKIKEQLEDFIGEYFQNEKEKIKIIRWEDYEKEDPFCKEITKLVYEKFSKNPNFRKEVFGRIKTTMTDRPFSNEQYWEMCNYLLDEFSVVTTGINYKEITYKLFFYPNIDSTAYFIEDIKKGKLFPELTKKLPREKVVLSIVN